MINCWNWLIIIFIVIVWSFKCPSVLGVFCIDAAIGSLLVLFIGIICESLPADIQLPAGHPNARRNLDSYSIAACWWRIVSSAYLSLFRNILFVSFGLVLKWSQSQFRLFNTKSKNTLRGHHQHPLPRWPRACLRCSGRVFGAEGMVQWVQGQEVGQE